MTGTVLALRVLALPARLLATAPGRRALAALAVACTGWVLIGALFAHVEAPLAAGVAAGPVAQARPHGPPARPEAAPRSGQGAASPARAALAWAAARHHVPRARVRVLQQQRLDARTVRVLVMVEAGRRLDTAIVTARRGPAGWAVR
ncbi:MAG TPA: hypothetical protein VKG45_13445 [Actinomycetes bacterium]|nr:hypothetical protein [Actinomycetes bacterium]